MRLGNTHPALRRCWHPEARGDELSEHPRQVWLLGEPLVALRVGGEAVVLYDRCPHRGAPLSAGRVVEGTLECAYHGWRFGRDGRCVAVPSLGIGGPLPPRAVCSAPVAVTEAYGLVFAALEEPLVALPEPESLGEPARLLVQMDPFEGRFGAGLLIDNQLDVAHFAFLHRDSFGGQAPLEPPRYQVEGRGEWGFCTEMQIPISAANDPGVTDGLRPLRQERTMTYRYLAPFHLELVLEYPQMGGSAAVVFWVQPETAERARMYVTLGFEQPGGFSDEALAERVAFEYRVVGEDLELQARFHSLELALDLTEECHVRADRASVEYRRLLTRLVEAAAAIPGRGERGPTRTVAGGAVSTVAGDAVSTVAGGAVSTVAGATSGLTEALVRYWHPVCWGGELGDAPLTSELLGRRVVLWRDQDGRARAGADQCPHRGTALSLGAVDARGCLVCPYHGWRYDEHGDCVSMPQLAPGAPIPARARLELFACEERYGLVWVCLGEPAAGIPEFPEWDDPAYRHVACASYTWRTSAGRMVENFTDFGHLGYLHDGLLGNRDELVVPAHRVQTTGGELRYELTMQVPNTNDEFLVTAISGERGLQTNTYVLTLPFAIHLACRYHDSDTYRTLFFAVQPRNAGVCTGYCYQSRNFALDAPDEPFAVFQELLAEQDRPIVESQLPTELQLEVSAELQLGFDRVAIAYRRALAGIASVGPGTDEEATTCA